MTSDRTHQRMEEKDARIAELEAEVERWRDKANEAGAAYGNANTKHHEELDRANRLERLADTLAGRAVDLEDRARAAEAELAALRAALSSIRVEDIEAAIDNATDDCLEGYCHCNTCAAKAVVHLVRTRIAALAASPAEDTTPAAICCGKYNDDASPWCGESCADMPTTPAAPHAEDGA